MPSKLLRIAGQTVVMKPTVRDQWQGTACHGQVVFGIQPNRGEPAEVGDGRHYWSASVFGLSNWDSRGHESVDDALDAGPGNCLVEAIADALVFALGVELHDAEPIADRICSDTVESNDRPLVERLDVLFRLMAMRPAVADLIRAVWHDPDNLGGGGFCRPYVSAHERLKIKRDVVALGLRPEIVDLC